MRRHDPANPGEVADGLLRYLADCWRADDLTFLQPPEPVPHGWETHTWCFQLAALPQIPSDFAAPLTLRIYSSPEGLSRLEHETAVQRHLHARGYPVARPLLLERDSSRFGGPFMLMEQVPGLTMLQTLVQGPWRIFTLPSLLAETQCQLHALPVEDFPAPAGPFLDRQLVQMRSLIDEYDLRGLLPGLHWLSSRRPAPPATRSILHLDFHPLNLLCPPGRSPVVLDWAEADVGDPHADVASTLLALDCQSAGPLPVWALPLKAISRWMLRRRYLRAYRRLHPLDSHKLTWYRAWAALHRLAYYGRWLAVGPLSTGCKLALMDHLSGEHIRGLERYFERASGVPVQLEDRGAVALPHQGRRLPRRSFLTMGTAAPGG